jgi:pimeloyl-ACP methyl ester carboxylesterase
LKLAVVWFAPAVEALRLDLPRSFIVGALTLNARDKPPSGEDGRGLEQTDVHVQVVPDAGHWMMFQNPDAFAEAIANELA